MSGSNRVTLSRRTLLTAAGTSALMLPARPTRAGGLATTPGQTEGPFYRRSCRGTWTRTWCA